MAHTARAPVAQTTPSANAPHASHGVLKTGEPSNAAIVNRKKQKRRQKELAKRQADEQALKDRGLAGANVNASAQTPTSFANPASAPQDHGDYVDDGYDDQDQFEDDYYSEDAGYNEPYDPAYPNGHDPTQAGAADKKAKKKQKKGKALAPEPYPTHNHSHAHPHSHNHAHAHSHPHSHGHGRLYARDTHAPPPPPPPPPPSMSSAALRSVQRNNTGKGDRIWNTSTQEERENIKEFWLSLGEEERKSLVKIEKEAVLRKMKEQQKHSCSCTVCGRKRTAIEEELEVLYDAYYEELEQYVFSDASLTSPRFRSLMHDNQHENRLPPDRMTPIHYPAQPSHGHIEELPDDEEDEEDDGDEEDYSDEEEYDDDDYSDEEPEELPRPSADFFNFGNSLTVKGKRPCRVTEQSVEGHILISTTGGILTVADDLLKNDGKKFIEMMEQLAERRMQREEEAQYAAAAHPTSYQDSYRHQHGPPPEEDDYDDDEDEDYDSQEDEEYDDEEETMVRAEGSLLDTGANVTAPQDTMTEEQRMQEGRRMFQIFAARMFEQRVLTAYREKVARERQQKLLEELDEEKTNDAAREAKKARDAEKKKQKKQAQKQKLAEEKARKEAEKAAEEAAVKEAELKRQEEQKKRREEQRMKKEEQRKAQEAEIARKNAEKMKRQKEEQDRRQEAERKAREQKDGERKAREEVKKKEREEREAKEREGKERKSKSDKERKDREAKEKADMETLEKSRKESQASQQAHAVQQATQGAKRAVAPALVPIPPGLQKQPSGYSPHVSVATPVIPKAPTPIRARQGSQQGSKGSSPKAMHVAIGQAKAGSPPHPGTGTIAPKTILSRPPSQPPVSAAHLPNPASPMHGMIPPPGMPGAHGGIFGMPNMNGFPQNAGPMMPQRTMGGNMPGMFSPPAPIGSQFRPFPPNGMPGPPPGMAAPGGMPPMGRGFPDVPPGFPGPGFGAPGRDTMPAHSGMPQQHSRQQSGSSSIEPPNAIQRPAPGAIQRPGSVKPLDGRGEMDELSRHLGSSALLDDDESPEPPSFQDRRPSVMAPGVPRAGSNLSAAFGSQPIFANAGNPNPFGINAGNAPSNTWGAPSNSFGQSPVPTGNGWGPSPTSTWPLGSNSLPFGNNAPQSLPNRPRPHQIRVNMCKACQSLSTKGVGTPEGFQTAISILSTIQGSMVPPITEDELDMMVTTEGTPQNGGGSFQVNRLGPELLNCLIKWIPDAAGDGLQRMGSHGVGEIGGGIGSPIVGPRDPVSSNTTPFGSMRGFPGGLAGLGGLGSSGL
jgi:hypothetical protein